jgi:hypothetical protein
VHFKITQIEIEGVPQAGTKSTTAIATGELGCWINPLETQILQSGVEHSLFPASGLALEGQLYQTP